MAQCVRLSSYGTIPSRLPYSSTTLRGSRPVSLNFMELADTHEVGIWPGRAVLVHEQGIRGLKMHQRCGTIHRDEFSLCPAVFLKTIQEHRHRLIRFPRQ